MNKFLILGAVIVSIIVPASSVLAAGSAVREEKEATEAVTLHSCIASGDCSTILDLNIDGFVDLVVGSNEIFQPIQIYTGRGTGFFDRHEAITLGFFRTSDLNFADLDGDGDLDLVETTRFDTNNFYVNDGTNAAPYFTLRGDISAELDRSSSAALADFDSDGDIDVAVANETGTANKIYLNETILQDVILFGAANLIDPLADYDHTRAIAVIDVDGDGDADLIAANDATSANDNRLYINQNNGVFGVFLFDAPINITPLLLTDDAEISTSVAVGDIDGDGDLDIVVSNRNAPNRFYLNNTVGAAVDFATTGTFGPSSEDTSDLKLVDVDLDGRLDVIVAVEGGVNRVHRNVDGPGPGFGGFDNAGTEIVAPDSGDADISRSLDLADLNLDGSPDLVIGNQGDGSPAFPFELNFRYLNNGCTGLGPCDAFLNDVPEITAQVVDPLTTDEDTPLELVPEDVTVSDGDNLVGDFALIVSAGANYTVNGTTITPAQDFTLPLVVTVQITDGEGTSDDWLLNVTVNPFEDAPVFTSTPVLNATEGAAYVYGVIATDGDTLDTVTISAATLLPIWLSLTDVVPGNPGTATLSGTPTNADVGNHSVSLQAMDNDGTPIGMTQDFTIIVADVNFAPEFTSAAVTGVTEATQYIYAITTFDSDGDVVAITAPTLPGWLSLIDNGDGTGGLVGSPTGADLGQHAVELQVQDPGGEFNTQPFTIDVAAAAEGPTITLIGDNPLVIQQGTIFADPGATADDPQDGVLTGQIAVAGNVDIATLGDYVLTYSVSDSAGNSTQIQRVVTVQATPPPPPPPPSGGGGGSAGLTDLAGLFVLTLFGAATRRRRATGRSAKSAPRRTAL